jgi:hypothetical protein
MGAREIAVAGQIDRDTLRAELRRLGDEYIFYMLCDAIELTQLARLGGSFCDFARARVNLIKGLG